MTKILLIAKRDLASYLHGTTGWIIVAAMLFIHGVLFRVEAMGETARYSHEILEQFFFNSSGITMVAAVLLSMKSFAEEQATGTDTLLRTSPLSEAQQVVGKYLAVMGVLGLLTVLTIYMPGLIMVNGKISLSHVLVGYVGVLAIGSASASIGVFASSLFRSQVAAAMVGGVIVVAFVLAWLMSALTDPPFSELLANMTLHDKHFIPFQEGRLLTGNLVFYGAMTFGFLLMSTRVLEGRRWR